MVVLVIDSSAHLIERWQVMLAETENVKIVYGAVSFKDALKLFQQLQPQVVLLDANLPGNRSIELLKELKGNRLQTTVIAMASRSDDQVQKEFLRNGADFFFDKYYDFEKIPEVLKAIAAENGGSIK